MLDAIKCVVDDIFSARQFTDAFNSPTAVVQNSTSFLPNELFAIMLSPVRLSSVCPSSVTLVHPTQAVEIFGNVSMPFGTLAIR